MHQTQAKQERQQPQRVLPMAMRVANAMHKLGIVGLPRNYEIFYSAMNGTNLELKNALFQSGTNIDQEALDRLYGHYCARADDESVVSKICDHVESRLNETISLIKQEQTSVENYGSILNQASQKLNPTVRMPPEVVSRLVGLLSTATESTQNQGRRTLDQMESSATELASIKSELKEYKKLAETDALTGLFNRRAFDKILGSLSKKGLRKSAMILGDIDKFKALNDTYGHPFGDMVIKTVAKTLQTNAREDVVVARVGGEEFAVFSENIDELGIQLVAERLRVKVAETAFSDGKVHLGPGKITISFGTCHARNLSSPEQLYANADEALYSAKRMGRNRVESYQNTVNNLNRKNLSIYES